MAHNVGSSKIGTMVREGVENYKYNSKINKKQLKQQQGMSKNKRRGEMNILKSKKSLKAKVSRIKDFTEATTGTPRDKGRTNRVPTDKEKKGRK